MTTAALDPASSRPGAVAPSTARRGVDDVVERHQRRQQAQRQDQSRAPRSRPARRRRLPSSPRCCASDWRRSRPAPSSSTITVAVERQHDRVVQRLQQTPHRCRRSGFAAMLSRIRNAERQRESEQRRHEAQDAGEPIQPHRQAACVRRCAGFRRTAAKRAFPAAVALHQHQCRNDEQHQAGRFARRRQGCRD